MVAAWAAPGTPNPPPARSVLEGSHMMRGSDHHPNVLQLLVNHVRAGKHERLHHPLRQNAQWALLSLHSPVRGVSDSTSSKRPRQAPVSNHATPHPERNH
jgi:hypothetical protein